MTKICLDCDLNVVYCVFKHGKPFFIFKCKFDNSVKDVIEFRNYQENKHVLDNFNRISKDKEHLKKLKVFFKDRKDVVIE